jgi:hypothetical protein
MVAGIGSVGEAATSLRIVAADQGAVVERLAGQMSQTIGRVEQMSGLAAQLERRQSDRMATTGPLQLKRAGVTTPVEASLLNIGTGGIRVLVGLGVALAVGDVLDTEIGPPESPIAVHLRVANLDVTPEGNHLGLQFLITDETMANRVDAYIEQLVNAGGVAAT